MIFWITIKDGYKNHKLLVEHISINSHKERFKISGRDKFIVLESNRPLFRGKGLKYRKPDWKLVEGEVKYTGGLLDQVKEAINELYP